MERSPALDSLVVFFFWPYWLSLIGMIIFVIALHFLFPEGYTAKTALGILAVCIRP